MFIGNCIYKGTSTCMDCLTKNECWYWTMPQQKRITEKYDENGKLIERIVEYERG